MLPACLLWLVNVIMVLNSTSEPKPAQGTSRVTNIIFRTPHEGLSGLTLANYIHLPGKRVTAVRSLDDTLAITHGERPGAPPPTCD